MSDESNTLDLTEVPDNVEGQEETEVVEEVVDDEESEEEQVEEEGESEEQAEETVEDVEEESEEEPEEEEEQSEEEPEEEQAEKPEEEQAEEHSEEEPEEPEEPEEEQAEQPEEEEEESEEEEEEQAGQEVEETVEDVEEKEEEEAVEETVKEEEDEEDEEEKINSLDFSNDQKQSIYNLECNINYYIDWINKKIDVEGFINCLNNINITDKSTSEKNLSSTKILVDKLIKNIIKLECIKENNKCKHLYNILLSYGSIERFNINDIYNINNYLNKFIYNSLIHYSWKLNKKEKYRYVNMINV